MNDAPPPPVERLLDGLHARATAVPALRRFTAFTRLLLAVGFVVPALPKLAGVPFTQLPTTTPVGYFFDAFFQAEGYYAFVGAMQLLAGLLLLWPRTATLGAVLYAPIIVNVFLITATIDFRGTRTTTGLMLLAVLWLLAWDWPRLKGILPLRAPRAATAGERGPRSEYGRAALVFAGLGALGYGALAVTGIGLVYADVGPIGFAPTALAGALFGLAVAWHARHDGPARTPERRAPHRSPTGRASARG